MVHDFTLVYVLNSGMGSQEDVLRRLMDSDCADVTVGWGRPGHVGLAFSREASNRDAAVTLVPRLRWHKRCQGRSWSVWMRGSCRGRLMALSSNRAVPAQSHVRADRCMGLL